MAEFTGERVLPDRVDNDLWNEHFSRYLFVSRLCRNKRVIDIGCGAGYGTAELATTARAATGLDIAPDAIAYANSHYEKPNLSFLCASGTALPFADGSADLLVAFEMIEHLEDWELLLTEARRVLAPSGEFVVSTPNTHFYAESRKESGPNPYHSHEFEFAEFRAELAKHFAHVSLFVQNHGPSIVFQPVDAPTGAEVRVDADTIAAEESNFFIAVCAAKPLTGAPTFVHVPSAANVLRERSQHIAKLEQELVTKDDWLDKVKAEHSDLVVQFRAIKDELEERNRWADELNTELADARDRIDKLHEEKDAEIAAISKGYEEKVAALESECASHSKWATETQEKLDAKIQELADCVGALHKTEATVVERTEWAQRLNAEVEALREKLSYVEASRWVRFGDAFGVGPGKRLK